jgi:glyoxylase-like metal-dependent hydrolase (beta-lactamase superfamily II)
MTEQTPLLIDVFTVPSRPLIRPPVPPPPPGGFTWAPIAATLISGERDAVLVDTLVTVDDANALADWVEAKGKRVIAIYVTHSHGDHYLGAPTLLARFPGARLVATETVAGEITAQLASPEVKAYWAPMFDGRIALNQVAPEVLDGNVIVLEGHELRAVQAGQSDCEHSTYLHVPDASAVVTGDITYNGVHMHLGFTDHAKRLAWIETLRDVAALGATTVIAAHQKPGSLNGPQCIDESIQYIEDFDRLHTDDIPVDKFIAEMLALHGDRMNITTLYHVTYMLSGEYPGYF